MALAPHVSATGLPSQHVDPVNRSTRGPGPTSQWPETVPRGCQLGTRRRRAGANSGDQNNGGAHLRDARSELRLVVAVGGAGVAGNIADDEL